MARERRGCGARLQWLRGSNHRPAVRCGFAYNERVESSVRPGKSPLRWGAIKHVIQRGEASLDNRTRHLPLSPGSKLAQYEIIAPLGAGGMGNVYRARDVRLGREVALKVMADHVAADPEMRRRFEIEARAVAALSHPCIMAIHELAVIGGVPVAVMELLEGETLRARICEGRLPVARSRPDRRRRRRRPGRCARARRDPP